MSTSLADLFAQVTAPDVSLGPLLERVIWVLLSFSIVIVALRLYTKYSMTRRLYTDDLLMVIALAVGLVHAVLMQIALNHGFGRHFIYIAAESLPNLETTIKFGSISIAFGVLSPMFGRISFCCTLLYLSKTDPHIKPWPIYIFIFLQAAVNLTGVIVFYSQCGSNLDAFWIPEKELHYNDFCWSPSIQTHYGYFMGSFNTITDAFLTILPAILVKHTKLSTKSKIGVALLLCLSIFALACSVAKTYEAKVLSEVTDFTYDLSSYYVVALCCELNVVMITASIPLLRPLFRRRKRDSGRSSEAPLWDSHIPLDSVATSKDYSRTNVTRFPSISSLDRLPTFDDEPPPGIIRVTTQVEISYQTWDAPRVHAALVGLIQGEIANPALVQR